MVTIGAVTGRSASCGAHRRASVSQARAGRAGWLRQGRLLPPRVPQRVGRCWWEALTLASANATPLGNIRCRGGVTSYLEVLDSERQLFDAELGVARTRRDELLAVVRIYRALGGGWQE
jgi:hypothetical protein